jgi:hypothetical protein
VAAANFLPLHTSEVQLAPTVRRELSQINYRTVKRLRHWSDIRTEWRKSGSEHVVWVRVNCAILALGVRTLSAALLLLSLAMTGRMTVCVRPVVLGKVRSSLTTRK